MFFHPDAVIMVFCKAPIPGQVKTRLLPSLTAEEAAQVHCELAVKTLQTATQDPLCEVQLWCSASIDHTFFRNLADSYSVDLHLQQGADLGQRMHHAFCQALARFAYALVIGCDCPSLTKADLEQALDQLSQGDQCVLAPAEDGGYVLIGLNQPQPSLFEDTPWGTNKVLGLTRVKLQALSISYKELPMHWDVDTIGDLRRYRQIIGNMC